MSKIFLGILYLFSGILYPKVVFDFSQRNEPPFSATKRLEMGEKFPQELQFFIESAGNSFKYDFDIHIFTKKAYKNLFLKEISYIFEGGTGYFLKNAKFILPTKVYDIDEEQVFPCWITDSAHYWTRGIFMKPTKKTKRLPQVNFEKVFKNKKPGMSFKVKIICVYSFDDEPEEREESVFEVRCSEGEYVSPFLFW